MGYTSSLTSATLRDHLRVTRGLLPSGNIRTVDPTHTIHIVEHLRVFHIALGVSFGSGRFASGPGSFFCKAVLGIRPPSDE